VPVKLRAHEAGIDRLLEQDVHEPVAIEIARLPENRFVAAVVARGDKGTDRGVRRQHRPAGERARRFLDVGLGVVSDSKRKQLHHLAGEVLVRCPDHVLVVVEVEQHRRVLVHRLQELEEIPVGMAPPGVHLNHHERRGCAADAGGEQPVPEPRKALLQRATAGEHAVELPADDARRAREVEPKLPGHRFRGIGHGFVVEQPRDRALPPERVQIEHVRLAAAEPGAPQQVRGVVDRPRGHEASSTPC